MENTLFALGGLYQLLIYRYSKLIDGTENWIQTPIPGSHLFKVFLQIPFPTKYNFASIIPKICLHPLKHSPNHYYSWESWSQGNNPDWWIAYNKVKHERFRTGNIGGNTKEYYKFANLENILFALGGLYQLLIYRYSKLIDGTENWIQTPIPGSHLFKLTGNIQVVPTPNSQVSQMVFPHLQSLAKSFLF